MHKQISRRPGLAVAGVLLALAACAADDRAAPEAPFACLAPPALSRPLTFVNACPGEPGFPTVVEADGRDVLVRLPKDRVCQRGLSITKPGTVWIQGGAFLYTESGKAVISISETAGTAFVEGLSIDVAGKSADAIRVYRNTGRLIVQNTFARRISGQPAGIHGDLIHAQGDGPLQELVLQNVTGYTGYQGLFTPYRPESGHGARAVRLERVNVAYDPALNRNAGAGKPLMLLFFGSADDLRDRPPDRGTTLASVHVDASFWNQPFGRSVYPRPKTLFGRCVGFDEAHGISGRVCEGPPPGGDFAPEALVGTAYDRSRFCDGSALPAAAAAPARR
ncbi:MAG: hypothetical protein MUD06_03300 [Rhodospirillales bacterium]|jgi:hypothetical protein|nr:hypothetical protein [Rhodospirillales bacterium]